MKETKKKMGDRIWELEKNVGELTTCKREVEKQLEESQVKEKSAIDEVALLNVKADLSQMGFSKEVVDEKIVDEEENEVAVGENDL
ncbi:hypothetical protein VNO78_06514 [Psophocarpus tetragonolobus]|uniref:Uncharacterized protein n=1 Tax=Psophocarpus tetragonolobus TaxID=3891 RepID=A0AAN9SS88_PSOTE